MREKSPLDTVSGPHIKILEILDDVDLEIHRPGQKIKLIQSKQEKVFV